MLKEWKKIFFLYSITAFSALSGAFGSHEGNEGASNVTVIITNTISALSTASANNTNTDSDTITNTLNGRSFMSNSQVVYYQLMNMFSDLYELVVYPLFSMK